VIIVTTKDQETDRVWGKRQGASGYLVKPVPAVRLMEEIEAVMAD
jgi:twitching motility two-component system response regulator PilH